MIYHRCFDITPRQHSHVLSIDVELVDICSYAYLGWEGYILASYSISSSQQENFANVSISKCFNIFDSVEISHLVTSIIYEDFSLGTLLYSFDENWLKVLKSNLENSVCQAGRRLQIMTPGWI